MLLNYNQFLATKLHTDDQYGFEPVFMPEFLYGFQRELTNWSVNKGRAAIFADCGLGKTPMQLVWAENIYRKYNKSVLILTPLAVASQTIREGEKFGIECKLTKTGKVYKGINVTNYERLHYYNPRDFASVVSDESGILKNFSGKMRRQITDFLLQVNYRLLASATPAPNDYMELGNSSEALGSMGRGQMLGMFFTNSGESSQDWELKGHARKRFWRWICSWARALRKPSDLGFDDKGFILPPITYKQHIVESHDTSMNGFFYTAKTLDEQRAERRLTLKERCEKVAELVSKDDYTLVYCHLNSEGNLLEKLIPNAVQVAGRHAEEIKEERLAAFAAGQIKCLVTKPRIAGFGLNFQHCNHMTFFPSHSWESYYQAVRRCWRFGQKRPVKVDIVTSEGESMVIANMRRKEQQMTEMFQQLVKEMNQYQLNSKKKSKEILTEIPTWLNTL